VLDQGAEASPADSRSIGSRHPYPRPHSYEPGCSRNLQSGTSDPGGYAEAPRLWGLSPSKDQNFGGILMNVEQAAVFLAAIFYFVVRLIPEEDRGSSRA
jgi:hypothetical protein